MHPDLHIRILLRIPVSGSEVKRNLYFSGHNVSDTCSLKGGGREAGWRKGGKENEDNYDEDKEV